MPEALYWDTEDPYHYLRIDSRRDFDYAIFGGEDHKTGQETDTDKCYAELEKAARRVLPARLNPAAARAGRPALEAARAAIRTR